LSQTPKRAAPQQPPAPGAEDQASTRLPDYPRAAHTFGAPTKGGTDGDRYRSQTLPIVPLSQGRALRPRPTYQANVWDGREQKRHRRTFSNETAAKAWRRDAKIALRRGQVDTHERATLRTTADEWLEGARTGAVRNRSGDPYKPSAIRGYRQALHLRVLPVVGDGPVADIRRADLQDLADELVGAGLSASTVQRTIVPLKAIFRRELSRGHLTANPTDGLDLPAIRSNESGSSRGPKRPT